MHFLADGNILANQIKNNDFKRFGSVMTKFTGRRTIDPAYKVHLALYQAIMEPEEHQKAYQQVTPDFFDLIVIDGCYRGSVVEKVDTLFSILDILKARLQSANNPSSNWQMQLLTQY